jgi:CBS domain-containing protein
LSQAWAWVARIRIPRSFPTSFQLAFDGSCRAVLDCSQHARDGIANLLEKHGIKRVPVLKDGRLVGIISRANLMQALASRGLGFVDVTEADEVLRKIIVLNLRKLPWTAAMATVDVIVDRGVVNLWGVVRNEEEKNAIRVATEETPGVQAVNDHLRVYS